jgi:branched-chain amino acid transport system substrate-binding protein
MRQMKKIIILCIISIFVLVACSPSQFIMQREKQSNIVEDMVVAVPVPLEFAEKNTKFLHGIELALEDINSLGVKGKEIKLEIVDDQANFKTAVDLAQRFSKENRILAVIGHWYSDICLPISEIYEEAGLLTIVPTVSNPELTAQGYEYIFQSITSDKKITEKMCAYAKSKEYTNVVVYYEDSSYGENLARALEEEAAKSDLVIVDRRSGLVSDEQFRKAYDKWVALEFDAVLLALNMPEGANFIKRLRQINQEVGVIAADGLDVADVITELGEDAEGLVIVTSYNPSDTRPQMESFLKKYQEKYHEEPDVWAIQGYESLQLLARALKGTESFSSAALAAFLRQMEPWPSISGTISFNQSGEIEGREIYTKQVVNGQFRYTD